MKNDNFKRGPLGYENETLKIEETGKQKKTLRAFASRANKPFASRANKPFAGKFAKDWKK